MIDARSGWSEDPDVQHEGETLNFGATNLSITNRRECETTVPSMLTARSGFNLKAKFQNNCPVNEGGPIEASVGEGRG